MLFSSRRVFALLSGPLVCGIVKTLPSPEGLPSEGQASLAVLGFCVCWWLLGAVPLPVTSLVGLALLPTLGALPTQTALSLFGNQAVFFVAVAPIQTGIRGENDRRNSVKGRVAALFVKDYDSARQCRQ